MLIGICGGISAGKQSVANYLVHKKGFTRIHLARTTALQLEGSDSPNTGSDASGQNYLSHDTKDYVFYSVEDFLSFITKKWQQRWVTTDIWNEHILESLLHRPSFLLVGVDAPVSVRWKRYKARCATQHWLVEMWITYLDLAAKEKTRCHLR